MKFVVVAVSGAFDVLLLDGVVLAQGLGWKYLKFLLFVCIVVIACCCVAPVSEGDGDVGAFLETAAAML